MTHDEMKRARQMAGYMDAVLDVLAPSRPKSHRTSDALCIKCGKKVTVNATEHSPGEIRWVCWQCAEGDRPEYKPNTGWTQ